MPPAAIGPAPDRVSISRVGTKMAPEPSAASTRTAFTRFQRFAVSAEFPRLAQMIPVSLRTISWYMSPTTLLGAKLGAAFPVRA